MVLYVTFNIFYPYCLILFLSYVIVTLFKIDMQPYYSSRKYLKNGIVEEHEDE